MFYQSIQEHSVLYTDYFVHNLYQKVFPHKEKLGPRGGQDTPGNQMALFLALVGA